MPLTYSNSTGGITSDNVTRYQLLQYQVELPDAFGGNVLVAGLVMPVQTNAQGNTSFAAQQNFAPNSIAMPAVPVTAGQSLNWILEVNLTTGAVTLKAGAAATTGTQVTPSVDAGNVQIFQHTITNGDTIPYLRAPTLPDNWP